MTDKNQASRLRSSIRVSTLWLLVVLLSFGSAAAASQQTFGTLQPGGFRNIEQNLPINVVFVGYEQGAGIQQINQAAVQAELSQTYRSLNVLPNLWYGIRNFTGTTFHYNYNFVYADTTFENAFFGYLTSIAQAQPRTKAQDFYNAQNHNSLDVGQNHWIDAPAVEKWLANNADGMLGINTAQYTVFLINWYGRSDFKFHVYAKTDEPDIDTGVNVGLDVDSRKLIAWGGTTPDDEESGLGSLHRIWFYDLSAGPDTWSFNWNVDDANIDSYPGLDYRLPPIWEYGNLSGYRPFNNLSGDLGKVLRYVAVNALFTTSPAYKPAISAPKLPANLQLDVNFYQADPAVNARAFFNAAVLRQEVGELQPHNNFNGEVNDLSFSGKAASVYECWRAVMTPPYINNSCYGRRLFGLAFGDLFLYHNDQLGRFLEGDGDYEIPIFVYNTTTEQANASISGYADDNWANGTQSFVYVFSNPDLRSRGIGMTYTTIHEVGHHLGLFHPHEGYDYETDRFTPAIGDLSFVWLGDESNSVMSYLHINNDFSQFERDNMNRWMTAEYINHANAILPLILYNSRAAAVSGLLATADGQAASALISYNYMNYADATLLAKSAYQSVLNAAAQINVHIEPQAWPADYRARGFNFKFVDTVQGYRLNEP